MKFFGFKACLKRFCFEKMKNDLTKFLRKCDVFIQARLRAFLIILLIILLDSLMLFVYAFNRDVRKESVIVITGAERNVALENEIRGMVRGYPMENMTRYIAQKDEKVAAFMVSIAKKESDWGKKVPLLNGQDCYNYWGYREKRERMGTGGHTCFNSPREAVNTVAGRISELVYENNLDTPGKMVTWKCGSSCTGQDPESVRKWISDVNLYFQQLVN